MSELVSRLVVVLFRLFSFLPLGALQRAGAVIARWVHARDHKFRKFFDRNLKYAFPDADSAAIAEAVAQSGRAMAELPWLWMRPRNQVLEAVVRVSGWDLVEQAHRAGRGVVLLTPHMGAFEIAARYIGSRLPITVLYRIPRMAWLHRVMVRGREGGGVSLAAADASGVRRLLRTLKDGGLVGILPDQVPGNGEGVWADFFGRPAYTMTLAARFTAIAGGTVMVFAERLPAGAGFHLHFLAPEVPVEGGTEQRVAAINRNVEALVRRWPAQYIWGYKRYKRPPGVERPATVE